MKRDTFELLVGIGVLALGIGLLLFTFASAFALVASPGDFVRNQTGTQQSQVQGPSPDFSWSSSGLNFTVQDHSSQGSAAITSWQWDFGDGTQGNGQTPGVHVYVNPGPYTVTLTVRDANNQESRTFAQVEIVPGQTRSGQSVGNIIGQIPSLNFDLSGILLPLGVVLLTVGLYLAMAVMGGMITKAGWNLIKPKPETIRVRLKPRDLTRAFEEDAATMPAAASALTQQAPPPPPP